MSTLCSQADSCSLGAKRPALFSTLVVTEISLWTLTQPMCTCSCVWVCVHGCVCVCTCAFCTVTHVVEVERFSSSRGCLFFCWWLKPLAGERKAVRQFEMSESVSCAIRVSPLLRPSVVFLRYPIDLTPPPPRNNLVIWSYCQMCWISFPPGSSQYDHSSPTSGHWASWLDEKHQYHGKGETGSWLAEYNCIPGVFLHFQDIPSSLLCIILVGHACDSYKVVQPVQCKLWPSWRELPIFYVH